MKNPYIVSGSNHRGYHNEPRWWLVWTTVAAMVVAFIVAICLLCAYSGDRGCNAKGNAYGIESDYSFWANRCFATLPNGHTVNIEGLQQNAKGQIIYLEGGAAEALTK